MFWVDIKEKDYHCNFTFPARTKITTSTLSSYLPIYISIKIQTTGKPVTVPISLFIKYKYDIKSYASLYIAALPTKDTMLIKKYYFVFDFNTSKASTYNGHEKKYINGVSSFPLFKKTSFITLIHQIIQIILCASTFLLKSIKCKLFKYPNILY